MKILLVNDYATLTGGAEVAFLTLRDGLRKRGHDVRIFSSSARPAPGVSIADDECFGTTSPFRTLLQTFNVSAFWNLRRVLNQFKPDIVHVKLFLTQLSPLILPLLEKIPALYHAVWYRSICPVGTKTLPNGNACQVQAGVACYQNRCLPLRDWLPLMFQMTLLKKWRHVFKWVVANSGAVKDQLVAHGIEPVEVIWNGVPIECARPALSDPPTIGFAGRLVSEKGLDILLQAFVKVVKKMPNAKLVIAGEGYEDKKIKNLIIELQLSCNVLMLGYVPQSELGKQLGSVWVQAVPSIFPEPFGITAAEAMMRGTAVIASRAGGLVEIVQHEKTGLLVPPSDVDRLAEALLRLLQNKSLAEKMGRAGREFALTHFNPSTFADHFLALYEKLIKNGCR